MGGLDEWNSAGGGGGNGALGDEYYGADEWVDLDDGILETLIIVGLAATLAFLVWYRQQRQLRERREREARGNGPVPQPGQPAAAAAVQQEDRGLFPQPGDPEFLQWAAGGIGH